MLNCIGFMFLVLVYRFAWGRETLKVRAQLTGEAKLQLPPRGRGGKCREAPHGAGTRANFGDSQNTNERRIAPWGARAEWGEREWGGVVQSPSVPPPMTHGQLEN